MSLPFKFKNEEIRVANQWDDLTVGQCIDLIEWQKEGTVDMVKLASIASGIPTDILSDMKAEQVSEVAYPLYMVLLHDNLNKLEWEKPTSYVLDGVRYTSMVNMQEVKYGCMDIVEKTMGNETTSLIEKIPLIIAALSYKGIFTGREIEARKDIEDLANNHVMNLPIKIAYPLAAFFLTKYESRLASLMQEVTDTPNLKRERAFANWRSMVSSVRYTLSRLVTRSNSAQS